MDKIYPSQEKEGRELYINTSFYNEKTQSLDWCLTRARQGVSLPRNSLQEVTINTNPDEDIINRIHDRINQDKIKTYCNRCGNYATKVCNNCKEVYYCSKDCQILDWKYSPTVPHRYLCGSVELYAIVNISKLGIISVHLTKGNANQALNDFKKRGNHVFEYEIQKYKVFNSKNHVLKSGDIIFYSIDNIGYKIHFFKTEEDFQIYKKLKVHDYLIYNDNIIVDY
jgi:hypothetical protein